MARFLRSFLLLALLGAFAACGTAARKQTSVKDLTQFIDPLIGSGGHGHVFVGANVPFGMVQLGPTNITEGWDWCSGYHYSDSTLVGFAHTHLSGTGIGDKGDIHFMPVTGNPGWKSRDYLSTYRHENETAQAGYYSLLLDRYGITAELTATPRVGYHRYTYPGTDSARVLINLFEGIGWDAPVACRIEQVDDHTIEGYRLSKGWAADDRVFFVARFDRPIKAFQLANDTTVIRTPPRLSVTPPKPRTHIVPYCYGVVDFGALQQGEQIGIQVGISGASIDGARANLLAEAADKSFDQAHREATQSWNDLLSHVQVESKDTARLRTFYTAIYHASIFPSVFNDVTGEYRGADGIIRKDSADIYTIFSLWDTYRSAHPLFTITAPERVPDFVNSFIRIYEQQGKVPVWHLAGNETDCMVGFPSIQVMGDAILKGFTGFDVEKAFNAMADYERLDERGLKQIRELGFLPADQENESVAKALEYCISDWTIAQVAKKLGYMDEYAHFLERSKGYAKYFDPSDRFMKGLLADSTRRTPFNPNYSDHRGDDFCEGNAWQYTWLVPHDFEGLFALFPSEADAEAKLDSTFTTKYIPGPNSSPDISGLIGQYAQGNEPNHSTIYAYAYLGSQWKTAKLARQIMDDLFNDTPEGLCGNEDCGQMSAWYIFNALGFYPANPVNGAFVLGSPLFDKITFPVGDNKSFTIVTKNNSAKNIYIQSIKLNKKTTNRSYITYQEIMAGGTLEVTMGPEPNKAFGREAADRPRSDMWQ